MVSDKVTKHSKGYNLSYTFNTFIIRRFPLANIGLRKFHPIINARGQPHGQNSQPVKIETRKR